MERMSMNSYLIIFVVVSCFWCASTSTEETRPTLGHPTVHTTNHGLVRGNTYAVLNSTVHVFWSIPFAEPPVGQLRFQRPVPKPVPAWSGVLDGTRRPDACYQLAYDPWVLNVSESEDCLYLNVYVPDTAMNNINVSLTGEAGQSAGLLRPVMFYIYGGAYATGSSSVERYNSSALAILNDVVVVTSNYRLGAYGYLYSASEEAPGNAGLYDQLTALRWVHDNIRSFGGDPEDVTIFGNSAGSFAVSHMIMSKLTHGLFNKAILMSGVRHPHDAVRMNSLRTYAPFIMALGAVTNCSNALTLSTLAQVTACLKLLSADELTKAHMSQEKVMPLHGPVPDADFFGDPTDDVFAEAARRNLTVLMGVMKNEGGFIVQSQNASISNLRMHLVLESILISASKGSLNVPQRLAIHFMYTNWVNVSDGVVNRQLVADAFGDAVFVCPTNEFAEQFFNHGINVYYYVFNERPSISQLPESDGAVHADELHFVFGHPLEPANGYTEDEAESSRRIIKIFGNFAKYGVPSYGVIDSWPKYTTEHKAHVELQSKGQYQIKKNLRALHCALWNNLIPKLAKGDCTESTNV